MQEHSPGSRHVLRLEPLSAEGFAPFGDVIEAAASATHYPINDGFAERFHDLARIDTATDGGHALVSIFRAKPQALPLQLSLMERHALSSQLFMPLAPQHFIVVVAAAGPAPRSEQLRGFLAGPWQGVNLARGTWHHPLLAPHGGDFLVIDRGGPGSTDDCEEQSCDAMQVWIEG